MGDDLADFNNLFSNMENTIKEYNNNKNKYCDSACEREKRISLLQKKYDFTNNIYTHGKDILWRLQKKLILEKSGSGSLNREIHTKAEAHVNGIKSSLDEIVDILREKIFNVQQQNSYIVRISDLLNNYKERETKIKKQLSEKIKSNNVNNRLTSFYIKDENDIRPFKSMLEYVYSILLVVLSIVVIIKMFMGRFPTSKARNMTIISIISLIILPYLLRKISELFKPYDYTGDTVDNKKRYRNLME